LGDQLSLIRYAPTVVLGVVVAARAAAASSSYVATINPLAAILRELVPDATRVQALLPPGASPHTFEPRPSDLRGAQAAGALFFVSSELDGWAARLPARRTIAALDLIPPEHRLASEPGSEDTDPHFWTDPMAVKASLAGLADVLCALEQADCAAVRRNAERFSAALERLDREVQDMLEPVRGSRVVLFHPSFRYFLRRYGLVLAGVIESSPGKEPTPRSLTAMVKTVRDARVKVVFTEPQLPARPAEALAEAAGIRVATLDPLGGVPGRRTYAEIIRYNARVLREALQ
jgi:ABC-type Zn uptake system ZnuABC Zn-binding protein ZnuA